MSLVDDARLLAELKHKVNYLQHAVEMQSEALERLTGLMSEGRPTLREIIEVVGDFFSVTPKEIKGERHIHDHAYPRLIVYYLARKLTRLSLTNIAERIGDRDHTTIRSGFLRISRLVRRNEVVRDDIDELRARIAEKVATREALLRHTLELTPRLTKEAAREHAS